MSTGGSLTINDSVSFARKYYNCVKLANEQATKHRMQVGLR